MDELFEVTSPEQVERVLIERLGAAGVWKGRESDGVAHLRIVEQGEGRLSIAGTVWLVSSQSEETFWICAERGGGWSLFYGVEGTTRRSRAAWLVASAPDELAWRVALSG